MTEKPTYEELEKRIQELEKIDSEKKLVREKLYKEIYFGQALLQAAPVFFVAINPDGKTIMINETMLQSLGYKQEEVVGKDYITTFVPKKDREALSKIFDKLIILNEPTLNENYILTKDGKELLIEWHGRSVFNKKGEFDCFVGLGIDITERNKMEVALRESELTFRKLFEESSDAILLIDETGVFVECNQAALDLLKMTREQFLFLPPVNISPEFQPNGYKSKESAVEMIELAYKKGLHRFDWTCVNAKGGEFIVDVSLMPIVVKGKTMLHTTWRDITERKQMEEKLKKEHAFLKGVMNSIPGIFYLFPLTENPKMLRWNDALRTVTGYTDKEIGQMNPMQFMEPRFFDIIGKKMKEVLEKESAIVEATFVRKDGSCVPMLLTGRLLTIDGIHYDVGVGVDITELKNLEKRLQQAQKMEAIGTLAGGIAHDFNNILSGIFGYSQLAETHIHNPEKAKNYIQQVVKGAKRAAELVHQILTFSRQKETEKHPFRAYLEVKEALKLLRSSIPSTIEIIEKIDSRSMIIADHTKIHQVVMNLCTNAYHAMMDKGGILNVSLKDIEISEPRHMGDKDLASGKYLRLEVSDTGHGMDNKTLEKAFDPYFTTKKMGEGTGLGLAIVKAIVEEHDGFLEVTSIPDKGTNFYIHFPITEQEAGPKQNKNEMASIFEGNESIMMVDDEEDIRLSCKEILESYGYRVHCFQNGIDAFKEFEKNPHQFDLIITDMTMPGMTGIELIQKINEVRQDIPSILCSGFSGSINDGKATQMGASKYLMKPVLQSDLASAIRELVDKFKFI